MFGGGKKAKGTEPSSLVASCRGFRPELEGLGRTFDELHCANGDIKAQRRHETSPRSRSLWADGTAGSQASSLLSLGNGNSNADLTGGGGRKPGNRKGSALGSAHL